MVHLEQAAHRLGHLRGVESADERQEPPGGIGEPGYGAGRVRGRALAHRVHGARRAQGDDDIAGLQPEAEGGRHVVPGARRHHGGVPGAGVVERAEHLGHGRVPVALGVDDAEKVEAVDALSGRPVAGAGGVPPVGGEPTGEAVREPVVGQ